MGDQPQLVIDTTAIDQIFAAWDRPGSPGAALALTVDGDLAYARGYGLANLEYDLPIKPDSVFHVASVSKQFTAACVFSLALDGQVDLAADIHGYLPYVPDFGRRVSVWQLIHHASGMRDQWELLRWAGWRMDDVITQDHLLRLVKRQRQLNFEPGAEWLYCNTGYTLLAELVRAVSGDSLRQFAARRFFGPLGMDQTLFYDDHEEIVPGRAYSYAPRAGDGFRKSVLNFANVGATSLFTTATDLAKWLCHLGAIENTPLARLMQTRLVLNSGEQHTYAGGLDLREVRGLRLIGHSGSDAGYRSYCGRLPDHGLGVVILCNLGTMNPAKLAEQVAAAILGHAMRPAAAAPAAVSPDAVNVTLAAYGGTFVVEGTGMAVVVSERSPQSLFATIGEHLRSELVLTARDRFWAPALEQSIMFDRDPASGTITGLSMAMGNTVSHARRRLPDLDQAAAVYYIGDYYSHELDTTYRVRARDSQLVVEHSRLPDLVLMPVGPDEFEAPAPAPSSMRFVGRSAGAAQATGIRLSGTRCRDVVFDRLPTPSVSETSGPIGGNIT